jgi:hypothetical protein
MRKVFIVNSKRRADRIVRPVPGWAAGERVRVVKHKWQADEKVYIDKGPFRRGDKVKLRGRR